MAVSVANPPRKKGTKGEGEVVRACVDRGLIAVRTPAGSNYDVAVQGSTGRVIKVLATRPDKGRWLATVELEDLIHMLYGHGDAAAIEVKRYKRFSLHSIFEKKFGRG